MNKSERENYIFESIPLRHLCPRSCYPVHASTCYKQRVTNVVSYSESARLCGLDRRPDGFRTDAHLSQSCPPNPVSVICLSKLQPGSQNCHKPATPALTYRESSCISSGSLQFPPRMMYYVSAFRMTLLHNRYS